MDESPGINPGTADFYGAAFAGIPWTFSADRDVIASIVDNEQDANPELAGYYSVSGPYTETEVFMLRNGFAGARLDWIRRAYRLVADRERITAGQTVSE